jgi:hypothetical protein
VPSAVARSATVAHSVTVIGDRVRRARRTHR